MEKSKGFYSFYYDENIGVCYRTLDFLGFPWYKIGDDGTIWSRKYKGGRNGGLREWKQIANTGKIHNSGYIRVNLSGQSKLYDKPMLLHHIVLLAFVGPPRNVNNCEACHSNGNRIDNRLENLRWDSQTNNQRDRVKHGTSNRGENNPKHLLTNEQVMEFIQDFISHNWNNQTRYERCKQQRQFCKLWSSKLKIAHSYLGQILEQKHRWPHIKEQLNFVYPSVVSVWDKYGTIDF